MTRPSRPLTDEEYESYRLARLVAAEQAPYFMHALFAVAPVASPAIGTLAVDAWWRMYVNPDLLVGERRWQASVVPGELAAGVSLPDGSAEPICSADGDFVRRRVAHAVQEHETVKGRGSVPAGLNRWAATVLAPPTVAWNRLLRAAVRRAVADRAGRVDYTYSRPSRRVVPGVIKPSLRGPSVVVSVVVDTSGSMSQADLDAAMGEVDGVLRSSGVAREQVKLLACDAAAATAQRVRSVSSVQLVGGGGTDMRVGIAAAESARPTPHVIIVLTDGDTDWPGTPPRARLVCAVISSRPPTGTPEWATTVHIPPAAVRATV